MKLIIGMSVLFFILSFISAAFSTTFLIWCVGMLIYAITNRIRNTEGTVLNVIVIPAVFYIVVLAAVLLI